MLLHTGGLFAGTDCSPVWMKTRWRRRCSSPPGSGRHRQCPLQVSGCVNTPRGLLHEAVEGVQGSSVVCSIHVLLVLTSLLCVFVVGPLLLLHFGFRGSHRGRSACARPCTHPTTCGTRGRLYLGQWPRVRGGPVFLSLAVRDMDRAARPAGCVVCEWAAGKQGPPQLCSGQPGQHIRVL